jgi:hypothetical protein
LGNEDIRRAVSAYVIPSDASVLSLVEFREIKPLSLPFDFQSVQVILVGSVSVVFGTMRNSWPDRPEIRMVLKKLAARVGAGKTKSQ